MWLSWHCVSCLWPEKAACSVVQHHTRPPQCWSPGRSIAPSAVGMQMLLAFVNISAPLPTTLHPLFYCPPPFPEAAFPAWRKGLLPQTPQACSPSLVCAWSQETEDPLHYRSEKYRRHRLSPDTNSHLRLLSTSLASYLTGCMLHPHGNMYRQVSDLWPHYTWASLAPWM